MTSNTYFTAKKTRITFILSVLVFILHLGIVDKYANMPGNALWYNIAYCFDWFLRTFATIAVPLFFIISGALFYRDYTQQKYLKKLKNRLFTLVIPFLLWNVINMIIQFILTSPFVLKLTGSQMEAPEPTLINILKGLFLREYNGQMWFVQTLIIFCIFAPVIYCFLKSKIVGAITIASVIVLFSFEIRLPNSVFGAADSIIYYLIGAYIGCHYFDSFMQKRERKTEKIAIAVLFTFSSIFVCLRKFAGGEPHPYAVSHHCGSNVPLILASV